LRKAEFQVWNMVETVTPPIILPWPLQNSLEIAARLFLQAGDHRSIDFLRPAGEEALVSADSVSWRVFKNPLSLFVGGVTAVIMELAEPHVRAGVWEHTTFRSDPLRRLRRTGLAAMVTVYGARGVAEPMIARVRRMHDTVASTTLTGEPYRANHPELLNWVYATAAYGFVQAYHAYVQPLSSQERNSYYAEGVPAAVLYGATTAPRSEVDLELLFEGTANRLERSDIVFEFLAIMRSAPILPLFLRPLQDLMVRAAIDLTPLAAGDFGTQWAPVALVGSEFVRHIGALADRLVLGSNPAVQACRRLRLPSDYLYVNRRAPSSISAGHVSFPVEPSAHDC
jgi:uncharacterized protein (DUF2236 family)